MSKRKNNFGKKIMISCLVLSYGNGSCTSFLLRLNQEQQRPANSKTYTENFSVNNLCMMAE